MSDTTKTVKCPTCKEPGIENFAYNKPFFFCQKCRVEIAENSQPPVEDYSQPYYPSMYESETYD